jgi:hypothetical protein
MLAISAKRILAEAPTMFVNVIDLVLDIGIGFAVLGVEFLSTTATSLGHIGSPSLLFE